MNSEMIQNKEQMSIIIYICCIKYIVFLLIRSYACLFFFSYLTVKMLLSCFKIWHLAIFYVMVIGEDIDINKKSYINLLSKQKQTKNQPISNRIFSSEKKNTYNISLTHKFQVNLAQKKQTPAQILQKVPPA